MAVHITAKGQTKRVEWLQNEQVKRYLHAAEHANYIYINLKTPSRLKAHK